MRPLVLIGILLIVGGILGLAIEHVFITETKTVLEVGPLKVQAKSERAIPIPTVTGIITIVAGLCLVFVGRKRA